MNMYTFNSRISRSIGRSEDFGPKIFKSDNHSRSSQTRSFNDNFDYTSNNYLSNFRVNLTNYQNQTQVPKTKIVGTPNINKKYSRQYSNEEDFLNTARPQPRTISQDAKPLMMTSGVSQDSGGPSGFRQISFGSINQKPTTNLSAILATNRKDPDDRPKPK